MRDVLVLPPLRVMLCWRGEEVWRIEVGWAGEEGEEDSVWESQLAGHAAAFFRAFLSGERPDAAGIPLAWHRVQGFTRDVLVTLANSVDRGEWISYSGLARLCGVPGGARAVGRVMGANPWPLLVPCHRVLRKDGGIGGFSSGIELKRYLLRLEGVAREA